MAISKYTRDNSRLREYGELARAAQEYSNRVAPPKRKGATMPTEAEKATAREYYRERVKRIREKYDEAERKMRDPVGSNPILNRILNQAAPAS
jgi:hypothetical protein